MDTSLPNRRISWPPGWLSAALFLFLASGLFAARWAKADPAAPQERIIVLRNGHVIYGRVTYLGDHCSILLNSGGQVRLASKEIVVDAADKLEAYAALRSEITSPRAVRPHLELAQWCIRERLFPQAAEELLLVMQLEPQHPQIDALSRQLTALSQQRNETTNEVPNPEENDATPNAAAAVIDSAPATDDLEQTLRSVPKDAVESFLRSIQPLLLNRCGTNRCHDAGSTAEFRLLRPSVGSTFWRRLNLRNLQATVAQIDKNAPDESRLLRMARTQHGGRLDPPFGEKEIEQYESLLLWVRMTTTRPGEFATAETPMGGGNTRVGASREASSAPTALANVRQDASPPAATTGGGPAPNEADDDPASDDPFDPEVFNRRFLPRAP
jgi:hypothetical protein